MLICQPTMTMVRLHVQPCTHVISCTSWLNLTLYVNNNNAAEGGDKDARDMRDMVMERRLRDGEDTGTWTGMAGFEKHTKVREGTAACTQVLTAVYLCRALVVKF